MLILKAVEVLMRSKENRGFHANHMSNCKEKKWSLKNSPSEPLPVLPFLVA